MKKVETETLDNVVGGATLSLSAGVINAIVKLVDIVFEIGGSFGSSVRRVTEDNVCPLD